MPDEILFPATIMPDSDWWHTLWPAPEAVLRTVGIGPGMQVVDLCCGDGHFTRPMCLLTSTGRTWGLDLDAALLAKAEAACRGSTNFVAVHADARDLRRHLGEPVDLVFIANTFHGVPDKTALSRSVWGALKPGGRFAIVNWLKLPREQTTVLDQPRGPATSLRMEPEDVRALVEPLGFELEKSVTVGPYHYAAVFVKKTATR